MLTEFTITAMVKFLQLRKRFKRPMVLMLGSRTGGLFRSQEFSTILETYTDSTFCSLSKLAQFAECYRILTRQRPGFSANDIDAILTHVLNTVDITDTDTYLADFIKSGVFDTIITTNMDTLIEDALVAEKLKNTRDFEILSLLDVDRGTPDYQRRTSCQIIYTFGQVASRHYKMRGRPGFLNEQRQRMSLLADLCVRDVMIIGLDPIWDAEIYQIFAAKGNSLWFINEETLSEDSVLYHMADARNGRTFTGDNANYVRFMQHLHTAFFSTRPTEQDSMQPDNLTTSGRENHENTIADPSQDTNTNHEGALRGRTATRKPLAVFISSVPQDDALLAALLVHIEGLKREKLIDTWHSRKIIAGQVAQDEIDRHLQSAEIILLLISADFIASDYINKVELKQVMERYNQGMAQIIPIIVRPCYWQAAPFSHLKVLPGNGEPVTSAHWPNQDSALLDIVQGIKDVINTRL